MNEKKESNDSESVRLQLAIARAGVASRRHAEEMIRDGLVRVNGKIITEMGTRVNPLIDKIEVEGRPLPVAPRRHWTVMLNKPVGYLSAASDRRGGRVVTELVSDIPARLVPAGRLDCDSCGLLILSDDGDLVARITHPRYGHRKVYLVEVSGPCDEEVVRRLREPKERSLRLPQKQFAPEEVRAGIPCHGELRKDNHAAARMFMNHRNNLPRIEPHIPDAQPGHCRNNLNQSIFHNSHRPFHTKKAKSSK